MNYNSAKLQLDRFTSCCSELLCSSSLSKNNNFDTRRVAVLLQLFIRIALLLFITLRNSIDAEVKKELCFGETLIVSCGHYEGEFGEEESQSEWSCYETEEAETVIESKNNSLIEIKDPVEEPPEPEKPFEETDDFHFYFFPDCSKPLPERHSKTSIVTVNGLPQVNPAIIDLKFCTCGQDKKGNCPCHTRLPCKCGAKTKYECKCQEIEDICICNEGKPNIVCTCKASKVCVCFPDGTPRPKCTCDDIERPCVCHPTKFPCPVCLCKRKPKFGYLKSKSGNANSSEVLQEISLETEELEGEYENFNETDTEIVSKEGTEESKTEDPCVCQKPPKKQPCPCRKGKKCICKEDMCVCGIQKTCACEAAHSEDEIPCESEDSKSVCSCPVLKDCTCDAQGVDCECFPKPTVCTCDSHEKCKCFSKCTCTQPCICDTIPKKEPECICLDKPKSKPGTDCTCVFTKKAGTDKKLGLKLKKVIAGKHGYRWCHDVDPRHTYFDYAYDRHNKIDVKEQEKEKFRILGLYDDESAEECPVHGIKVPPFEKKVRKPSLDCCSAVGGITISVETLGEDKSKFLVQVVAHSSKEGAKIGSKLVSILDTSLHTLEENRVEYITKKNLTKERRSYIAICDRGYYNKLTRICRDRDVVKRRYISFQDAHDFLLEGANVVILRYFGLRRYKGTIKTETVLIDGTICESIYTCPGVSQAIVNGSPMFVVKVERHIIEPNGRINQTLTVLSLRGYMISHEWADNNYLFHVNPLLRINPEKDEIEPHAPLRETWRQDLQLLSDYLEFKSVRSSEGARYVAETGALTATIRDYVQAILLLKPQDVVHFTRHYFSSALSALDLPHDEYFDPCPKHVRYYFFEQ